MDSADRACPGDTAVTVPQRPRSTISAAELDELIEQATVDCCNDSEQVTGLFTMIEEHLELPFTTTVLGVPVAIAGVDVTTSDEIVAICTRDGIAKRSRCSSSLSPTARRPGGNGSRHTAAGHAGCDRICLHVRVTLATMDRKPHDVLATGEARAQLPAMHERFRQAGADAELVSAAGPQRQILTGSTWLSARHGCRRRRRITNRHAASLPKVRITRGFR